MAHLIRKYAFPVDKDVMLKPPTLVDPISTAWYRENIKKSEPTITTATLNKERLLSGTDVISAKIRDSLSSNGTVRGMPNRYSQYNPVASSGKLDLYSPVNSSADKLDSRLLPSRTNDYASGANKYQSSNYMSTYASSYGPSQSYANKPFKSGSLRRDPMREFPAPRDFPSPRVAEPLVSSSASTTVAPGGILKKDYTSLEPSRTSSAGNSGLTLPPRDQSSTSPGRFSSMATPSPPVTKAASYQSDEHYMRQINDILGVHTGVLFNASPAQVTDYMFIGGYKDAENWQNLRRLGITHVLNMAAARRSSVNPYPHQSGIVGYEAFDADDHEMYNVMQHLPKAKAFIDRARWSGGKVLVHCAMGVNRSGAMCCGYLMTEGKMGMLEAMKKLKRARGTVLCNRGFQRQLLRLAKQKGNF